MIKIISLFRVLEWYDSKYSLYIGIILYLSYRSNNLFLFSNLKSILVLSIYIIFLLAFGYTFNDFCDQSQDKLAGKQNIIMSLNLQMQWFTILSLLILGIFIPIYYCKNISTIILVINSFAFAFAYSVPLIRLKERDIWGIITSALSQRVFPLLVVFSFYEYFNIDIGIILILSFLIGIRWILIHQVKDEVNDIKSQTKTFVLKTEKTIVHNIINTTFLLESLLLFVLLIFLLIQNEYVFLILFFSYGVFQSYLLNLWTKIGWERMIYSYDFAPLADFYYCWLPIFINFLLLRDDLFWLFMLPLTICISFRYIVLDASYVTLKKEFDLK